MLVASMRWAVTAGSGPGGSRTLVQTGKQYAFYTLSFVFFVGQAEGRSRHIPAVSPRNLALRPGAAAGHVPI